MTEKKEKRRGLGRGLSALMADVETNPTGQGTEASGRGAERRIPIDKIVPNPDQPRRQFVQADMDDLAESIRTKGVIQPLIVRPRQDTDDEFEIVAGERRWRAAQMAQLHELPVLVREFTDTEVVEVAIIENIQRADLNAVEEAMGYRQLMERFGHTQEKLAKALGKSRSHIANLMRLLTLPDEVCDMIKDGKLSAGHARALITSKDPISLAHRVVAEGLSVRETERLAKTGSPTTTPPKTAKPAKTSAKDADTKALEDDLSAQLKMRVSVDHAPGGEAGKLVIHYKSLEQLDDLCRLLGDI